MEPTNTYRLTVITSTGKTARTYPHGKIAHSKAGRAFQKGALEVRVVKNPKTDKIVTMHFVLGGDKSKWKFPEKQVK